MREKYLLLANVPEFVKVVTNNIDEPAKWSTSAFNGEPIDTRTTPLGICNMYLFNDMMVYVLDKILVEVTPEDVCAEINFTYSNETEFKHAAHILISFIVGYILSDSKSLYESFISRYLEKVLFSNRDGTIDIDAYRSFVEMEERIVNIKDHIPLQDIIFQRGISAYVDKQPVTDITAIDITNYKGMFNTKNVLHI